MVIVNVKCDHSVTTDAYHQYRDAPVWCWPVGQPIVSTKQLTYHRPIDVQNYKMHPLLNLRQNILNSPGNRSRADIFMVLCVSNNL